MTVNLSPRSMTTRATKLLSEGTNVYSGVAQRHPAAPSRSGHRGPRRHSLPRHPAATPSLRHFVAPRRRAHRAPSAGYTLLELLIVVGLLGLASAMLIPNIVRPDHMAAQAAIRLMIADLSFAQSDAVAHQEFRRVHFYDDGSGYCIYRLTSSELALPFDPDTADYIIDPLKSGAGKHYIVNFATDSRFKSVEIDIDNTSIDGGNTWVTYDSLGGTVITDNVPGTGGVIRVTSPTSSYDLSIAPFTGKMTVAPTP